MKRVFAVMTMTALFLLLPPSPAQQPPVKQKPAPKITYIKAGRLFDGTGDAVRENMVLVVEGERIQSVGTAAETSIPAGASVIDLSHATVLPGLRRLLFDNERKKIRDNPGKSVAKGVS